MMYFVLLQINMNADPREQQIGFPNIYEGRVVAHLANTPLWGNEYKFCTRDADAAERMFERFWRGARTRERGSGSGLGLSIVRSLVTGELRGTLSLGPGLRGGTRASIALPTD